MGKETSLKKLRRRLQVFSATITAISIVAGSAVAWVTLGGVDAARAGTLSQLRSAEETGGWRSISPTELNVDGAGESLSIGGFGEVGAGSDDAVSWFVQVTATAAEEAVRVQLPGSEMTVLQVDAGQTASVSALFALKAPGKAVKLKANAAVQIEAEAVAYLVPGKGGEKPAPGGSVAVSPVALVDTEQELGATIDNIRETTKVSPLGLGEVPSDGVTAVWVQAVAVGERVGLQLGSEVAREDQSMFSSPDSSGAAQGLTAVRLDEHGEIAIRATAGTQAVSLHIVGWVASAEFDVDRAVIDTGLVVVDVEQPAAKDFAAPNIAPTDAHSLYSVQRIADTSAKLKGSGADGKGVANTFGSMRGSASGLVVAEAGADPALGNDVKVTWLGYFSTSNLNAGDAPEVEITSPAQGQRLQLVESNGVVTFAGSASSGAGIVAVHLKQQRRYIGSAALRVTAQGTSWSYSTPAPVGAHTVTAVAVDAAGRETTAEVRFSVAPVAADDSIVAEGVVQLGANDLNELPKVTPDTLRFERPIEVRAGDILTMPITEVTPDALMRRVVSVQMVGGVQVVGTTRASLDEMILNTHILIDDEPIDTATQPEDSPLPSKTLRTGDSDAEVQARSASGAPSILTVGAVRPHADKDVILDYTDNQLINRNETTFSFEFGTESESEDGSNGAADKKSGDKKSGAKKSDGKKKELSGLDTKVKFTVTSGVPGESPALDLSLDLPVSNFKVLSEKKPAKADKKSTKKSKGLQDEVKGTTARSSEVAVALEKTLVTRNYQHFELKIVRNDGWFKVVPAKLEVLELSLRQIEDQQLKLKGTGSFAAEFGAERKDRVSFDVSGGKPTKKNKKLKKQLDALQQAAKTDKLSLRLGQSPPIPVGATGIVIWLSFYLHFDISVQLELQGSVEISQDSAAVRMTGLRWEQGEESFIEENKPFRKSPLKFSSAVGASVSVSPGVSFEVRVNEMLGGYIGLEYTISLEGALAAGSEKKALFKWEIRQKLDVVIGIRFEVFTKELFDLSATFNVIKDDPPLLSGEFEIDENGDLPEQQINDRDRSSSQSNGDRPLVLVIDVSGSMAGDRIENAKASLENIIREQPVGAEIGIWTYPDDSGCSAGTFKVPVAEHAGTGDLLTTIRGLETGGSTPTGEALDSVVMQLINDGHTGASLLLVTDGESNCQVPPCEVVGDILDMGFDLAVTGVAYQIAEAGREELDCIAGKTGSEVYEVDNDADLEKILTELSQAEITASIQMPKRVQAGSVHRVEVLIENSTAMDATSVELLLEATGELDPLVRPVGRVNIGNIPQGASVTRAFEIEIAEGKGEVNLTLTAWGGNVSEVVSERTFEVLAVNKEVPPPEPGPVLTEPVQGRSPSLFVVGDGMLAALGAEVDDSSGANDCAVNGAVGFEVGQWKDTAARLCAGVSTPEMVASVIDTDQAQLQKASHLLLSLGSEDIGLGQLLSDCAVGQCEAGSATFQNALRAAQELDVSDQILRLSDAAAVEASDKRAGSRPAVVVSAYPFLFPEDRGLNCSDEFDQAEARSLNLLVGYLNAGLEASVERARQEGVEAYFAKGMERGLQPARTLCSDDPGAQLQTVGDTSSLVLTESGAQSMTDALASWSEGRDSQPATAVKGARSVAPPARTAGVPTLPIPVRITVDAPRQAFGVDLPAEQQGIRALTAALVQPGQTVSVQGSGYQPGSQVYLTLETDRSTLIGRGIADARGDVVIDAAVPSQTLTGVARVAVLGQNMKGDGFRSIVDISVGAGTPWWVLGSLFTGFLLFVGAIVLAFVAVRRGARAKAERLLA